MERRRPRQSDGEGPGTARVCPRSALIGEGISINVTLLFSQKMYAEVLEAYIAGLETFVAGGGDPKRVASVASFFVSRIDVAVDKQLDGKIAAASGDQKEQLEALKGKVAIANAKIAYQHYKKVIASERWKKLAAKGAQGAAAAVGLDRHQKQGLQRRSLRRGTDRPRHGQHRAARDDGCVPRSWQAARQPRGECRRTPSVCSPNLRKPASRWMAITEALVDDGVQLFAEAADKLLGAVAHKRATDRSATGIDAQIDQARRRARKGRQGAARRTGARTAPSARLWHRDASVWTGSDESKWLGWLDVVAPRAERSADVTIAFAGG